MCVRVYPIISDVMLHKPVKYIMVYARIFGNKSIQYFTHTQLNGCRAMDTSLFFFMAKCFHMYSMSKTIFFALHCIKNKWEKKHGENFVFFGSNVIPRNVDIDMQNIACEHKIRI